MTTTTTVPRCTLCNAQLVGLAGRFLLSRAVVRSASPGVDELTLGPVLVTCRECARFLHERDFRGLLDRLAPGVLPSTRSEVASVLLEVERTLQPGAILVNLRTTDPLRLQSKPVTSSDAPPANTVLPGREFLAAAAKLFEPHESENDDDQ